MRRSEMDALLQELYDQVPEIPDCDGRCWQSCGPVDLSYRERQRIRMEAGIRIPHGLTTTLAYDAAGEVFYCPALRDKRCMVYQIRPMICRIWGTTEGLRCPYGCVPEGGFLPEKTALRLIVESLRIGGGAPPEMTAKVAEQFTDDDNVAVLFDKMWARGRVGMMNRITADAYRPRRPR